VDEKNISPKNSITVTTLEEISATTPISSTEKKVSKIYDMSDTVPQSDTQSTFHVKPTESSNYSKFTRKTVNYAKLSTTTVKTTKYATMSTTSIRRIIPWYARTTPKPIRPSRYTVRSTRDPITFATSTYPTYPSYYCLTRPATTPTTIVTQTTSKETEITITTESDATVTTNMLSGNSVQQETSYHKSELSMELILGVMFVGRL
jgi:hypothetical protein